MNTSQSPSFRPRRQRGQKSTPHELALSDERARQLADIGANNGEDADEISASDAFKEFPPLP
jgi:hypothetical protein